MKQGKQIRAKVGAGITSVMFGRKLQQKKARGINWGIINSETIVSVKWGRLDLSSRKYVLLRQKGVRKFCGKFAEISQ